jgi:hypothetical protein
MGRNHEAIVNTTSSRPRRLGWSEASRDLKYYQPPRRSMYISRSRSVAWKTLGRLPVQEITPAHYDGGRGSGAGIQY